MRIPLLNGKTFYMEQALYDNLMQLKKLNEDDYDSLILITGAVGSGKSTLGVQSLTALCPNLSLNNLAFNGEEFEDKVVNVLPDFDGVQVDEAIDGMNAREHYKQINIRLEKLLAKMRLKNMYITSCMPRLKDFSEFTIQRAALWIKCFTVKKKRGFFLGFSPKRLQSVFYSEKNKKNPKRIMYNFRGRFMDGLGNISIEAYRQAKSDAFVTYYTKTKKHLSSVDRDIQLSIKWRQEGLSYQKIGDLLGKSHQAVMDSLRNHADLLEKSAFNPQASRISNNTR